MCRHKQTGRGLFAGLRRRETRARDETEGDGNGGLHAMGRGGGRAFYVRRRRDSRGEEKGTRARRTAVQFSVAQVSRLRKAGCSPPFLMLPGASYGDVCVHVATGRARTHTNGANSAAPHHRTSRGEKRVSRAIVCFHRDSARPPRIIEVTPRQKSREVGSSNCRVLEQRNEKLTLCCVREMVGKKKRLTSTKR